MLQSPFKLLEAYESDEKDIFFGRDAEIFALYHLLQQTRLVLVYGASGTGKTSLIQAGLPKVFKITDWFRVSIRRKDNINASFRAELARYAPKADNLIQIIQQIYESRWIPIYLVFDQFEELFTLGNHEEREQFFRDIDAILQANLFCKLVISMREEYIGHLYDYEPIVPTLFDKRFRVESMKDATVVDVIQKMCDVNAIELEQGETTSNQILDQVKTGKQAAYLPYLQIYLHYLYEHTTATTRRPVFRDEGIEAVGALGDVLKKFIDSKTTDAQRYLQSFDVSVDFAQRLLDEFATGNGTKQSRKKTELAVSLKAKEDLVEKALIYFSDTAKLLRADENDVERYEPVHDVVAKQIHELRSAEDKEYKTFVRHLEEAFERWEKDKYSTERLLPEIDLSRVEIYRVRLETRDEFKERWTGLVAKSKEHHDAIRRRKQVRNIALVVITVLAIGASVVAFYLNVRAQEATKEMKTLRDKAVIATEDAKNQRDTAQSMLARFHQAEADKVMIEVQKIRSAAYGLSSKYPGLAKSYLRDSIRNILLIYPQNPILRKELKNVDY